MAEKKQRAQRRVLMLQCRYLGDAIVLTGLIEGLGRLDPALEIDVLTNRVCVPIFKNNPLVNQIYEAVFPISSIEKFGIKAAFQLLTLLVRLRFHGYDKSFNIFGDFRENLFGWMVSPGGNAGLIWSPGNPLRTSLRTGLTGLLADHLVIEADAPGVYAAISQFSRHHGATEITEPKLYDQNQQTYSHTGGEAIGLHLGASQECRIWPVEKWRNLAEIIRDHRRPVLVFGAPEERQFLEDHFTDIVDDPTAIVTGSFDNFFEHLTRIGTLICQDSFASHAAFAIGTPRIIINGANLSEIWWPAGIENRRGGPPGTLPSMFQSANLREFANSF